MNRSEKLIKLIEIYPPCKKNDPRPECHPWWGRGSGGILIGKGKKGSRKDHGTPGSRGGERGGHPSDGERGGHGGGRH